MTDPRDPTRRYTDDEVSLILRRASELEAQKPPAAPDQGGMTLAELEEIATEAGLNRELVRKAVRELDTGPPPRPARANPFLGAPVGIEMEREVEGELDEEAFERLVPEIQLAADGAGHPTVIGHTLTWQSTDAQQSRTLYLSISSSGGRTRIRIQERLDRMAGGLFGGIIGGVGGGVGIGVGVGVGVGALGSAAFAVAFPVAVIGGSYALARGIFRSVWRQRSKALSALMERIVGEVEGAGAVGKGDGEDRPRLDPGS